MIEHSNQRCAILLAHASFEDSIATITINNPAGNRISSIMRKEILAAIQIVGASQARVLLIKGNGADFCLGGDIREWLGVDAETLRPVIEVFAEALVLLEGLPIPTVAVVQGDCMGGGFELALSCDFIVASRSARFMFPEAFLGIMTLQGGAYLLAERIGIAKALEFVFLPEPIDATRLEQWNVINRIVSEATLSRDADAFAAKLATGPREAYARTKRLMRIWRDHGRAAARASLYDIAMPLFDADDVQAALATAAGAVSAGRAIPKAHFP